MQAPEHPPFWVLRRHSIQIIAQFLPHTPDLRGQSKTRVQGQPPHCRHQGQLEGQGSPRPQSSSYLSEHGQNRNGSGGHYVSVEALENATDQVPCNLSRARLSKHYGGNDKGDDRPAAYPEGNSEQRHKPNKESDHQRGSYLYSAVSISDRLRELTNCLTNRTPCA